MNPFDLPGPEFLAFYVALALIVLASYATWRLGRDVRGTADLPSDPYLLAYLRGGRAEALRTAMFMLLAEGAVEREGRILSVRTEHPKRPHAPLEAEAWAALDGARTFETLAQSGVGGQAAAALRADLEDRGLLHPRAETAKQHWAARAGTGALLVVGAIKLSVAYARGRHNVLLLIFMMAVVALVGFRFRPSPVTSRGVCALAAVQGLLEATRQRVGAFASTLTAAELTLIAAVFGLSAVAPTAVPFLTALGFTPQAYVSGSDAFFSSTSCGADTASTSDSSCGSSCGGGGGGGCGGCGS